MDEKNSAGSGRSRPKKMALLSVPLALIAPAIAEIPASANSEQSPEIDSNDVQNLATATVKNPVTANLPTLKTSQVSTYKVKAGDTVSAIAKNSTFP